MSADGDQIRLLEKTLASAAAAGWSSDRYAFRPIGGGTQATVWQGRPDDTGLPEVAVRLTPKPAALISRIAALVDCVDAVECPQTLAVTRVEFGGRAWTVQVCTWIGKGAATQGDPYGLGLDIARLHQQLADPGVDFTDRPLSFERGPVPTDEQELPAWYVARHLWRDRIFPEFAANGAHMRAQPIHGDLHWDNVVTADGGFGFIDFDKLMHAPRAFDLAKLIATGFFQLGAQGEMVRFQRSRAADLLAGYQSIQPLTGAEVAAIEGFAVMLNQEIARLGHIYDVETYRRQADAVGEWWTRRHKRNRSNPLGIRPPSGQGPQSAEHAAEQLTFFSEPDD